MKKARLLAVCVAVSMIVVGCGSAAGSSGKAEDTVYKLGDTVSTDIVDFTLSDAYFCYYADMSATSGDISEYAKALDEKPGVFMSYVASKGHVLIPVTYTVNNKDRTLLSVGGDWALKFKVLYDNDEYDLRGYDISEKDGRDGLRMGWSAISHTNGKSYTPVEQRSMSAPLLNELQDPGTVMYKTVGISAFDPDSLDDSFKITVNVINSEGEYEYFTYAVE